MKYFQRCPERQYETEHGMKKPSPKKAIDEKKQPSPPAKTPLFRLLRRDWVWALLLCAAAAVSYAPALRGTPLWDDEQHMTGPQLRSPDGLWRIWTQPGATQQYYPLTFSVFWLEHRLWGSLPQAYHIVNLLLHLLSALLLVGILRRLSVSGAWIVGAVFALHPIQVESVAWISELKNTLSGVFFFAAATAYIVFDRGRKRRSYAAACCLFLAGLMSKSVIATLPVSLLAVIWWKRGRIELRRDVVPLLPFFIAGAASGLFTAWYEHSSIISGAAKAFSFSLIERVLIAGRVFWFYLWKEFLPVDLLFMYPRWHIDHAAPWQYLFPAAALILAAGCWFLRGRWRAPLAVLVAYCATLFPVMGFFNVYPFRFSFVADHFQYLACVAPFAAIIAGGMRLLGPGHRFLKPAAVAALLAALAILTWRQSGMYGDVETLYRTILRKNPDCSMAHHNLAVIMAGRGRTDEAVAHYRRSVEIDPEFAESWNNLGRELMLAGRIEEASAYLRKALDIDPNFVDAHSNLGILLETAGRKDEAILHYRRALEINPRYVNAHNNLGTLLAQLGLTREAEVHLRKAVEIAPSDAVSRTNLGIFFGKTGRTEEAMEQYGKALDANPASADAHNNLGALLLNAGRIDEAVFHFRKVLEIDPDELNGLMNLSACLERMGRADEAAGLLEKALALAKSSGEAARAGQIEETIAGLRNGAGSSR
jgi:tetratricopeptide (TPR) repeat protein